MDFNGILAKRPQLFPQRVRIERKGGGYNSSGQRVGDGFAVVPGFEKLKAQYAPAHRGSGNEKIVANATQATTERVWTVPGRVEGIAPSMRLVEIDEAGASIGAHDILAVDVHDFGLHTVIETKRAI